MTETLVELEPIIAVLGSSAVKASYSNVEVWDRYSGTWQPGWKVDIDGTYRGARIRFSRSAPSLSAAAGEAHQQLKDALGLN